MNLSQIVNAIAMIGVMLASDAISLNAATPAPLILPITVTGSGWRQAPKRNVTVPNGVTQLVMEQRVGAGWKPVNVQHLVFGPREKSKSVAVVPPSGVALSQVRMVGYKDKKFPAGFTQGVHDFSRQDLSILGPVYSGGIINFGSQLLLGGTAVNLTNINGATTHLAPSAPTVEVPAAVESDIWKISGHQLFFFNQYRGLQVFDMTHPEAPVHTGSVRMAASGDQLYVLDDAGGSVALLGSSTDSATARTQSLFFVKVSHGVPALTKEINLTSHVLDSRMIGSKVYLLCGPASVSLNLNNFSPTSPALLKTVDFSNPDSPVLLPDLSLGGGFNVSLQAAGRYLLVGSSTYSGSSMQLIDTISESGAPWLVKSFPLRGAVRDKFKMSVVNGAAIAVTQTRQTDGAWALATWVETFPVDGDAVTPLAQLSLPAPPNESLYGTRFDGDRLYVVTFYNTDPLFVVNLADPTAPIVRGMVEVTGFSDYLEPHGDRLLAVGQQMHRVIVSLFDVSDETAPALLSRLVLGSENGSSYSEASTNEKAVQYFPEDGIAMVPFQGYVPSAGGYVNAMQVIAVGRDTLTTGLTIPQNEARRGAVMGDHLVSISGQEMLVLNRSATTADPEADLSLAWRVDRVVPFGDYLLQLTDGVFPIYGSAGTPAMLRVSSAADPDTLIEEIEMGVGHVIGTAQKDTRLFVAQWIPVNGQDQVIIRTWVLDLGKPPAVRQITSVDHVLDQANEPNFDLDKVQGLWVNDSTLVWQVPTPERSRRWNGWWGYPYYPGIPITIRPIIGIGIIAQPILLPINNISLGNAVVNPIPSVKLPAVPKGPGSAAIVLCPVSHATETTPVAKDVIWITSRNGICNASPAFASAGFLYTSYDDSTPVTDKGNTFMSKVRSWLQVVDFRAMTPVVRNPVSIPGPLLSVSMADAQGATLFTQVNDNNGNLPAIQASGYDGVSAYQLDSHGLTSPFSTSTVADAHLYFGHGGASAGVTALGYQAQVGHLTELGEWSTPSEPTALAIAGNNLIESSYGIVATATLAEDGTPTPSAIFDTPFGLTLSADHHAMTAAGLWFPVGDYGVEFLPWKQLLP